MKEQEPEITVRDPNWIKDVEIRFPETGEGVGDAQPVTQAPTEPAGGKKQFSVYPPGSFNFIPGMGCMGRI